MRTFARTRGFLTGGLFGLFLSTSTFATEPETPPPSPAELQKQIKILQEQVDHLNRETREHESGIDTLKRFPLAQWKDGFLIQSADNAFKLKLGLYTQADARFFLNDAQDRNTSQFLFRRVRP